MPVFRSEDTVTMGGKNPSVYNVIVADKLADLQAFHKRWGDNLWNLTPEEREIIRNHEKKASQASFERISEFRDKIIKTSLTLPDRGKDMYKSRTQIRVLVKRAHSAFLDDQNITFVPRMYVPVLNLMLRKEYARRSGVGWTDEVLAFFERETRGKIIDLLRSGQWVDEPETSDLENLNQQLKNFDLGRRSDLKWSSNQDESTADVSEKFRPKVNDWEPRAPISPVHRVDPIPTKESKEGLGGFWASQYAKEVLPKE
jgi:hypothetical protein